MFTRTLIFQPGSLNVILSDFISLWKPSDNANSVPCRLSGAAFKNLGIAEVTRSILLLFRTLITLSSSMKHGRPGKRGNFCVQTCIYNPVPFCYISILSTKLYLFSTIKNRFGIISHNQTDTVHIIS